MEVPKSDAPGGSDQAGCLDESGEASAQPLSPPPAVSPNSEAPGTILSIQALRFVAALLVVVFHAHFALIRRFPTHVPDRVDHAFQVGASGVHIFFVISGFVMVYTSSRSKLTPRKFLKRRLIRIYPIYWLVALLYLVVHALIGTPYQLDGSQITGAMTLLPAYSSLVIGPGWTLSFEMYFYVCFAIALFVGVRAGLILLSAFFLSSVAAGLLLAPQSQVAKVASDSLLLEFIMGAWLGLMFANGLRIPRSIGAILAVLGIALFATGFWFDYDSLPSVISWGLPSFLLVSGALAFERQFEARIGRVMAKLGDSSYLLYLSHVLVLDLLIATPIRMLSRDETAALWLSIPLAIACTVAAAIGYETIELPLLKAMKRMFVRPPKTKLQPFTAA